MLLRNREKAIPARSRDAHADVRAATAASSFAVRVVAATTAAALVPSAMVLLVVTRRRDGEAAEREQIERLGTGRFVAQPSVTTPPLLAG
jgi:hypothetical protein